ncbi:hypothetical protein HK104_004054 [Borealophlyctis nickersoniae]|nr:hypothetical protein HK104_004054 [Borealophlyctis nickersoniae]
MKLTTPLTALALTVGAATAAPTPDSEWGHGKGYGDVGFGRYWGYRGYGGWGDGGYGGYGGGYGGGKWGVKAEANGYERKGYGYDGGFGGYGREVDGWGYGGYRGGYGGYGGHGGWGGDGWKGGYGGDMWKGGYGYGGRGYLRAEGIAAPAAKADTHDETTAAGHK